MNGFDLALNLLGLLGIIALGLAGIAAVGILTAHREDRHSHTDPTTTAAPANPTATKGKSIT